MYHRIVKHKLRQGFLAISRGDFDPLLQQFDPHVHFCFVGAHAMGGEFHQRETVKRWFERVHRLFPGLVLEAQQISVSGFPWNTLAVTHFTVRDTLPDGSLYQNQGVQVVRLRWGKVVDDYLIEDTQVLSHILQRLGALGIAEAVAAPLQDAAV